MGNPTSGISDITVFQGSQPLERVWCDCAWLSPAAVVLTKMLCHNIYVIIQSAYEYGVPPIFGTGIPVEDSLAAA